MRLDKKADVPRVVAEFIRFEGAAFLEVMIDPDAGVYPMVGPGQAYDEMITGEHIAVAQPGRDQGAGRVGDVLGRVGRSPGPRRSHHTPVFGMAVHGSAGCSAPPCCSSSIDMLSGERTNAIRPSRGGRLMVTP